MGDNASLMIDHHAAGYEMKHRRSDRPQSRDLYGPAARRKMISELGEREKLHQCIRPLEWS